MSNICFDCANACGGCSWSRSFTPVEGWTATPSKIKSTDKYMDTYHITACPEFVNDKERYARPDCGGKKRIKVVDRISNTQEIEDICNMRRNGAGYKELIDTFKYSYYAIHAVLKQHGLTGNKQTALQQRIIALWNETDLTKSEIAERLNCGESTVRTVIRERVKE